MHCPPSSIIEQASAIESSSMPSRRHGDSYHAAIAACCPAALLTMARTNMRARMFCLCFSARGRARSRWKQPVAHRRCQRRHPPARKLVLPADICNALTAVMGYLPATLWIV